MNTTRRYTVKITLSVPEPLPWVTVIGYAKSLETIEGIKVTEVDWPVLEPVGAA
jgi:hypothetical protein